jgi:hypothetical protein
VKIEPNRIAASVTELMRWCDALKARLLALVLEF